jgi:phosphoribosylamine--glycine ligase
VKVLILGAGGREHALGLALGRSPSVTAVHALPGNPGLSPLATLHAGDPSDAVRVREVVAANAIDLVVIGPEAPLVAGVADRLREAGVAVFGPSRGAAAIEASKGFARAFMDRHRIPSARFAVFDRLDAALAHVASVPLPTVVKADGLASGKGVVVARDRETAAGAVRAMMADDAFGEAGHRVVIEEFLVGEEVSVFALTDGERLVTLAPSQDHKAVYDGDQGPNTGGMGAYAPWTKTSAAFEAEVVERVLRPAIRGLAVEGIPFVGCLYAGLMVTAEGLRMVEFNARLGDPETQVVLPLLDEDLGILLHQAATGNLVERPLARRPGAAVTVVLASGGYPGRYTRGLPIEGVDAVAAREGIEVIHAGTARGDDGILRTAGGRVLAVTALGPDVATARERAYAGVEGIRFAGAHARTDIAARALGRHG